MIVITGASEGIGYACAKAVLERTAEPILLTGRGAQKLQSARETLARAHRERVQTRVSDHGDAAAVNELIATLTAPGVTLDGAVLTVGANPLYSERPARLHTLDQATIESTIRTNCTHTLYLAAALLGLFRRQRRGVLILIGSQAGRIGLPGAAVYCATKTFLSGLAITAHREYAGRGVRVHLLHPGLVRTPRTAGVADAFAARHGLVVSEAGDVARRVVDVLLAGEGAEVEMDL
jgi:short-subunit dehydrogenase